MFKSCQNKSYFTTKWEPIHNPDRATPSRLDIGGRSAAPLDCACRGDPHNGPVKFETSTLFKFDSQPRSLLTQVNIQRANRHGVLLWPPLVLVVDASAPSGVLRWRLPPRNLFCQSLPPSVAHAPIVWSLVAIDVLHSVGTARTGLVSGERYSGQNSFDEKKSLVEGNTEWLARKDARSVAIFERRSRFLNIIVLSSFGSE